MAKKQSIRGRRANGEGGLRELPNGLIEAKLPPDQYGRRPKATFRTKTEAWKWLKAEMAKREQNLASQPQTLESFATYWLDEEVKPTITAKTYAGYAWVFRGCIYPHLGSAQIAAITRRQIVQLYNTLKQEGYSDSTIKNTSLRLSALFDAAVQHRYRLDNPAKGIKLAKPQERDRTLTPDQVRAVREAARYYHNGLAYDVFLLLGPRKGETLGLRWCDWNREDHTITINQQVLEIEGRVSISSKLKTEASRRVLPLTPKMEAALSRHEAYQREERAALGEAWQDLDLIFASERGTPVMPSNVNRQWALLRKRAGIPPLTIHELRHTFATLLGELGIEERVIGALLGHEARSVTAKYAHVTMAMKRSAVEQLEALIGGLDDGA